MSVRDERLWASGGRLRHAELYDAEYAKQLERVERIRDEIIADLPEFSALDEPRPPAEAPAPPATPPQRVAPRWDSAPTDLPSPPRVVRPSPRPELPAPPPVRTAAAPRFGASRWTLVALASLAALAGGVAMLGARTQETPSSAALQLPGEPSGLVAAGGQVWVAGPTAGMVWVLDGATGRMARSALTIGGTPAQVALDGRYAWIADPRRGWLVRASRRGSRALAKVRIGAGVGDVVVAAGAVWTANPADGTVAVFDPETQRLRSLHAGARPVAMAADGRHVIVADAAGALIRLDARSRSPVGPPVLLGGAPIDVALAGDRAWIVDAGSGTVRSVDVISGRRGAAQRVCRIPVAIAADVAAVYVVCRGDRMLVRLDPRSGAVRSKAALPQAPTALALDSRHVWIAAEPSEVIHVDR